MNCFLKTKNRQRVKTENNTQDRSLAYSLQTNQWYLEGPPRHMALHHSDAIFPSRTDLSPRLQDVNVVPE